jgi:hypothetical protein
MRQQRFAVNAQPLGMKRQHGFAQRVRHRSLRNRSVALDKAIDDFLCIHHFLLNV